MSTSATEADIYTKLRKEAEARLNAGTAPADASFAAGVEALQLLYKLSSDPASAGDALKLLHELQVHQVELDLQISQMGTTEQELDEDLSRFRALYDLAPFPYFCVDREGRIIEANISGVELFGGEHNQLIGQRIEDFLDSESRPILLSLLNQLTDKVSVCEVPRASDAGNSSLRLMARLAPDGASILLACCELQ